MISRNIFSGNATKYRLTFLLVVKYTSSLAPLPEVLSHGPIVGAQVCVITSFGFKQLKSKSLLLTATEPLLARDLFLNLQISPMLASRLLGTRFDQRCPNRTLLHPVLSGILVIVLFVFRIESGNLSQYTVDALHKLMFIV